jgi:hypothetical protein
MTQDQKDVLYWMDKHLELRLALQDLKEDHARLQKKYTQLQKRYESLRHRTREKTGD